MKKILRVVIRVLAVPFIVIAGGLAVFFVAGWTGIFSPGAPAEQPVTSIRLSGLLADPLTEISGMAWYEDYLILLPQYPDHAGESGDGLVFALPKAGILAYLDGQNTQPLEAIAIPFEAPGLREQVSEYEGLESIGFSGDRAYLTIEAGEDDYMMGYIMAGTMAPDLSRLVVDTENIVPIQPQTRQDNKTDEAMIVLNDRILTFYEINGAALNPRPVAHVFSLDLQPQGTLPAPSLEYRLTDAALASADGRFWVVNTFFFYRDGYLRPDFDPLAETFGRGASHALFDAVERLVEMKYSESGVTLTDTPPVQLKLLSPFTRNWEALVMLDDRGFLLMTDRLPLAILGFVPMP